MGLESTTGLKPGGLLNLTEQKFQSDAEHQWNAGQGSGTTLTDINGSLDGTINGATWVSGDGVNDYHLEYDGSSDNTDLGSASRSEFRNYVDAGTGTLLIFVRPATTSDRETPIGSELTSSRVGLAIEINESNNGDIRWVAHNGNDQIYTINAPGGTLNSGEWNVIVGVCDSGSDAYIYHANVSDSWNVTQEASGSISGLTASDLEDNVTFGLPNGNNSFYYGGDIDLAFSDDTAWTQQEIQDYVNLVKTNY